MPWYRQDTQASYTSHSLQLDKGPHDVASFLLTKGLSQALASAVP